MTAVLQQAVQTAYPDVYFWAIIGFTLEQLWGSIGRTATVCLKQFTGFIDVTETKVCNMTKLHDTVQC